jgi:oligoribonuclease
MTEPMVQEDNILWIDLETTGLDPDRCSILEVAAVVTSPNLRTLYTYEGVVEAGLEEWEEMNEWCRDTHTKSGLWHEAQTSILSVAAAEEDILRIVGRFWPEGAKPLLGGQSVHFDRGFIRKHMPALDARLSHRHLDVSSFLEALKRWTSSGVRRQNDVAHRALPDILWSINCLDVLRVAYF